MPRVCCAALSQALLFITPIPIAHLWSGKQSRALTTAEIFLRQSNAKTSLECNSIRKNQDRRDSGFLKTSAPSEQLTRRIIACLDVDAGRVVKGVRFVDLRDAGDPAELARVHAEAGADEIVL